MKLFSLVLGIAFSIHAQSQWNQLGQDLPGFEEETYHGTQVSISDDGSTIAVSGPGASTNDLFYNGQVRLFRLEGNQWTPFGQTLFGTTQNEEFGASISLNDDGTVIAVASPWANGGDGKVSVYEYENDIWSLRGNVIENVAGGSGGAVSISHNGEVVAMTSGNTASVYELNGTVWEVQATRSGNELMRAICISADGTRVVYSGQEWMHHFDKVGDSWTSTVNMLLVGDDGTNAGPSFLAMSNDGNVIAKGAEQNTDGGSNAGKIVVMDRTDNDSWVFSYITGSTSWRIGKSVSLNNDGTILTTVGTLPRVFEWQDDAWVLSATIPGGGSSSQALSGDGTILITGDLSFSMPNEGLYGMARAYGNLPNTSPILDCPDNIVVSTDPNQCGAVVNLESLTASDLEDGDIQAVQTDGLLSGDLFPVGGNQVTFSATDSEGSVATCSYAVTVNDVEIPIIECTDFELELSENGVATLALEQVLLDSADNCGIDAEFMDETDFSCFDLGSNDVTVTVTDIHGNEATCTSEVTVVDVIAPEIICQNTTIYLNEEGTAAQETLDLVAGFSDNCNTILQQISYSFSCEDVGTQMITSTVEDGNGNMSTCISEVLVVDSIAPQVICQDVVVVLDELGEGILTVAEVDLNSSDNCELTLNLNNQVFDCESIGLNMVTLDGVDASGNVASCVSEVSVMDITAPEVLCPPDITEVIESTEMYAIEDYLGLGIASAGDYCTEGINLTEVQSPAPGTMLEPGQHEVTITATDESGNESLCTFMLTVEVADHVEEYGLVDIVMYPNPSANYLIFKSEYDEKLELEVLDLIGRTVHQSNTNTNQQVDLSFLEDGEYIVRLSGERGLHIDRLLILK